MKTNRIIGTLLALSISLAFAGCQLARQDAGREAGNDRLIGVLVTKEYLDLFDIDGYLGDHLNGFTSGDIIVGDDRQAYQGRLYAALQECPLTDQAGETTAIWEYVFPHSGGIGYFAARIPAAEKEDGYISSGSDEAISDGRMELFFGDTEEKIILEGTIYLAPEGEGCCYLNPVYQAADGSVYAVSGSGIDVGGMRDEGAFMSQTFDESTVITENGEQKTFSTSVKISVAMMLPPEKVVVLQMDADNRTLSRREYKPGKLPDSLTPAGDTAYILTETYKHDRSGAEIITWELYDQRDETLAAFYLREDGICVKRQTTLEWNR